MVLNSTHFHPIIINHLIPVLSCCSSVCHIKNIKIFYYTCDQVKGWVVLTFRQNGENTCKITHKPKKYYKFYWHHCMNKTFSCGIDRWLIVAIQLLSTTCIVLNLDPIQWTGFQLPYLCTVSFTILLARMRVEM